MLLRPPAAVRAWRRCVRGGDEEHEHDDTRPAVNEPIQDVIRCDAGTRSGLSGCAPIIHEVDHFPLYRMNIPIPMGFSSSQLNWDLIGTPIPTPNEAL